MTRREKALEKHYKYFDDEVLEMIERHMSDEELEDYVDECIELGQSSYERFMSDKDEGEVRI